MSRASRITLNPHETTAVVFHAPDTPSRGDSLEGYVLKELGEQGPNKGLNPARRVRKGAGIP